MSAGKMSKHPFQAVGALLLASLAATNAQTEQPATQEQAEPASFAETEIKAAIADWVDIYNRNDWGLLANQFEEDAVMMPPNSPAVVGRAAIAAWEAANEGGFRIALTPDEISIVGDRAIVRGRSCVFIPLESGTTGVDVGKFLEVRHRQSDGRWLVSHDVFNSDLPIGSDLSETCPDEIANGAVQADSAADVSN